MVTAFTLAGCNGGNGSSEATTSAVKNDPPSLEVIVDYKDQNSDYKNIEVFIDDVSEVTLKDCSGSQNVYAMEGDSHTVRIVNSDNSSTIAESEVKMDKSKSITFTIHKDSVDVAITELEP